MSDVRLRGVSDILTVLMAPDRNQIGAASVGRGKPYRRDCVSPAMSEKQITQLFGFVLGGLFVTGLVLNALTP